MVPLRVALLEDQMSRVRTIENLFNRSGHFEVVDVVHSVDEADAQPWEGKVDVVLVDRNLPDGDGLEFAIALHRRSPAMMVYVYSETPPPGLLAHGVRYLHDNDLLQWPARVLEGHDD